MDAIAVAHCFTVEDRRRHVYHRRRRFVHKGGSVGLLLVAHVGHVAAILVRHVIGDHLATTVGEVHIVGALKKTLRIFKNLTSMRICRVKFTFVRHVVGDNLATAVRKVNIVGTLKNRNIKNID
jgi:hypothetical protein